MTRKRHSEDQDRTPLEKLIALLLRLPWADLLVEAWKTTVKAIKNWSTPGMYQALEYESTLELQNPRGKKATFSKREKVRYLQDHIIAYQDQSWGDGEILVDYRCTPGKPVDRYRFDHEIYIIKCVLADPDLSPLNLGNVASAGIVSVQRAEYVQRFALAGLLDPTEGGKLELGGLPGADQV